jgi:hypothetical protein
MVDLRFGKSVAVQSSRDTDHQGFGSRCNRRAAAMSDGLTASFLRGDLARCSPGRGDGPGNIDVAAAAAIPVVADPGAVVAGHADLAAGARLAFVADVALVVAADPGPASFECVVPVAYSGPVVAGADFAGRRFVSAHQTWVVLDLSDLVCLSFDPAVHRPEWRSRATTTSLSN